MGSALGSWEEFVTTAAERTAQVAPPDVWMLALAGFKDFSFSWRDDASESYVQHTQDFIDRAGDFFSRADFVNQTEVIKRDRPIFVPHQVQGFVSSLEGKLSEFYNRMLVEMVHTPFRLPPENMQTAYHPWYRAIISVGYGTGDNVVPAFVGNIEFILLFDGMPVAEKGNQKFQLGIVAQLPVMVRRHRDMKNPQQYHKQDSMHHFVEQTDKALRYLWGSIDKVTGYGKDRIFVSFMPAAKSNEGYTAIEYANYAYHSTLKGDSCYKPQLKIGLSREEIISKPRVSYLPAGSITLGNSGMSDMVS